MVKVNGYIVDNQIPTSLYKQIKDSEYLLINTIFVSLILFIFIYSLAFASSGAYPIKSACADVNTPVCISKGLSRAFSQIMLGNVENAKKLNTYSLLIFLFFAVQFLSRILLSGIYLIAKNKLIIIFDIVFSLVLFIFCFKGFFIKLFEIVF